MVVGWGLAKFENVCSKLWDNNYFVPYVKGAYLIFSAVDARHIQMPAWCLVPAVSNLAVGGFVLLKPTAARRQACVGRSITHLAVALRRMGFCLPRTKAKLCQAAYRQPQQTRALRCALCGAAPGALRGQIESLEISLPSS